MTYLLCLVLSASAGETRTPVVAQPSTAPAVAKDPELVKLEKRFNDYTAIRKASIAASKRHRKAAIALLNSDQFSAIKTELSSEDQDRITMADKLDGDEFGRWGDMSSADTQVDSRLRTWIGQLKQGEPIKKTELEESKSAEERLSACAKELQRLESKEFRGKWRVLDGVSDLILEKYIQREPDSETWRSMKGHWSYATILESKRRFCDAAKEGTKLLHDVAALAKKRKQIK